ncbi:uncharacterized protein CG13380-like [Oculina patagonica]
MNRDLMYRYYQGDTAVSPNRYFGLTVTDNNNNSSNDSGEMAVCNCNRSPETIKCNFCGRSFIGRKQVLCQIHKNTIHLMDFSFCVFCKHKL